MYHFFVKPSDIKDGKVIIEGADVNHIKNVLRMKEGERLLVSDGEGTDYVCEIVSFGSADERSDNRQIICNITSKEGSSTEPDAKFYLFQGLPKSDKFEHIVQKSVELGVFQIIPVSTARSVVKYDDKKKRSKLDRWKKIAEGAAKQSHRGIVPEVKEVMGFSGALEYAKEEQLDMILMPYENFKDIRSTKRIIDKIKPRMRVGIFIGPEGGFEEQEVERAVDEGAELISLGNRILRTETAPLMLLSVLVFNLEIID